MVANKSNLISVVLFCACAVWLWSIQDRQARELKVLKLCAAGKLAEPCRDLLGAPDQEIADKRGNAIWNWKSGSRLSANSDTAIISKDSLIVEILDLDQEAGKRRFRELYSELK